MRERLIGICTIHDLFIMRNKLIFHDLCIIHTTCIYSRIVFSMRTELIFGLLGHTASLLGKTLF